MKPWWESNTMRALVASAIAQLLAMLDIPGDVGQIVDAIFTLAALGSLILAAFGRMKAVQPVTLRREKTDETDKAGA